MTKLHKKPTQAEKDAAQMGEAWQAAQAEVTRLRDTIAVARWTLRVPANPDCTVCNGSGIDGRLIHDEDTDCACIDPVNVARERFEVEQQRAKESRDLYRSQHGHEPGERCWPTCPQPF